MWEATSAGCLLVVGRQRNVRGHLDAGDIGFLNLAGSVGQWVGGSVGRWVGGWVGGSVGRWVGRWVGGSVGT